MKAKMSSSKHELYQHDPCSPDQILSDAQSKSQQARSLLSCANVISVLKILLSSPPYGPASTSLQSAQSITLQTLLDTLASTRTSDIPKSLASLDSDQLDWLMKYIYKAMSLITTYLWFKVGTDPRAKWPLTKNLSISFSTYNPNISGQLFILLDHNASSWPSRQIHPGNLSAMIKQPHHIPRNCRQNLARYKYSSEDHLIISQYVLPPIQVVNSILYPTHKSHSQSLFIWNTRTLPAPPTSIEIAAKYNK